MSNVLSGQDAIARVHLAKIRTQEVVYNDQVLVADAGFPTSGEVTKNMGRPNRVLVAISASETADFTIQHSFDGVKFFHDAANDVSLTAGQETIVEVLGAQFIRVSPSVLQTSCSIVVSPRY